MTNYILKPLSLNKKATGNAYYFSRRNKEKILKLIKKIFEDNLPSMLPEDREKLIFDLRRFFKRMDDLYTKPQTTKEPN